MDPADCSSRSSLIRVHTVCLYAKNRSEKFVRIFSRGHNQAKFSGADFLGILRVKVRSSRSVNLLALFLGRLSPLSGSPVLVLILAPVTDWTLLLNQLKGRMTAEMISWSLSMKVMWPSWDSNLLPCSQTYHRLCYLAQQGVSLSVLTAPSKRGYPIFFFFFFSSMK